MILTVQNKGFPILLAQVGLSNSHSSHKVGILWSSLFLSISKICLDPFHVFTQFKTKIRFNIKQSS